MSENEGAAKKRPQDSKFKQQTLKAWQPILTPVWVIGSFLGIGALFLVLGGIIFSTSDGVVELECTYDFAGTEGTNDDSICTVDLDNCKMEKDGGYVYGNQCTMTLKIEEEMVAPIYFYYKLDGFYQNHRRYVKSRNDNQLRGTVASSWDDYSLADELDMLSDCVPLAESPSEKNADGSKLLYPCGLVAASFFTDRFGASLIRDGAAYNFTPSVLPDAYKEEDTYKNAIPWSGVAFHKHASAPYGDLTCDTDCTVDDCFCGNWVKEGITWEADKEKFKQMEAGKTKKGVEQFTRGADGLLANASFYTNIAPASKKIFEGRTAAAETSTIPRQVTMPDVDDEDFIVWMRTAGLPTFKKLYRKITKPPGGSLKKGDELKVTVDALFLTHPFEGKKSVVLSTTSWLGGKNDFLGIAYLVVGGLCVLIGVLFFIKYRMSGRKLGDMNTFRKMQSQQSS